LLLDSFTTTPPAPALPLNVTVPLQSSPPVSDVGSTVTDDSSSGATVKVAVLETPAYVAVILAEVDDVVAFVVTVKVTEDWY